MTEFLQQLLNGLSLGAIYALIALGYTMVYGVLRFINFAHSDVFMVGAFIGFYVGERLPSGTITGGLVVLAAAMAGCAVLGILIERIVYRPLRGGPTLNVLITAIGMSLFLEYTGQLVFGATPRAFPSIFPAKVVEVHGLIISMNQVIVILVAAVLMVALEFTVYRTKIGTAMRAVALNPKAAQLVGINVDVVISFTFGLGSMLAAAGGVLYALNYPSIDPLMGVVPRAQGLRRRRPRRNRQHPRRRARRPHPRHGGDLCRRVALVDLQGRDRLRDPDRDPPFPPRGPSRKVRGREGIELRCRSRS